MDLIAAFNEAQTKAFKLDPTLNGDQLDRIGNLIVDKIAYKNLDELTTSELRKVIRKVKSTPTLMG